MLTAPCTPTAGSPRRVLGSVRRTTHVDVAWVGDDPGVAMRVEGAGRDLATGGRGGEVIGQASFVAGLHADRTIVDLDVEPRSPDPTRLVGARAASGFRALLMGGADARDGDITVALLDELPVVAIVAGYALLRSAGLAGLEPTRNAPPGEMRARMGDVCSGWRLDGSMMQSVEAGLGVPMQDCPPAPSLTGDDPLAWHGQSALEPGAMRRRRRIDVVPAGARLEVDAMFRDTYGEASGGESVLHEYTVRASVDATDGTILEVDAEPRVLPFPECPLARDYVGRLRGMEVALLRESVPSTLSGTESCTHLNDLLRALADVIALGTQTST